MVAWLQLFQLMPLHEPHASQVLALLGTVQKHKVPVPPRQTKIKETQCPNEAQIEKS